MSVRSIFRAVAWTLRQAEEAGTPTPTVFRAECLSCDDKSPASAGKRIGPEMWALTHTGKYPSHRDYRAVQADYWRVFPADSSDVADPPAGQGATP